MCYDLLEPGRQWPALLGDVGDALSKLRARDQFDVDDVPVVVGEDALVALLDAAKMVPMQIDTWLLLVDRGANMLLAATVQRLAKMRDRLGKKPLALGVVAVHRHDVEKDIVAGSVREG